MSYSKSSQRDRPLSPKKLKKQKPEDPKAQPPRSVNVNLGSFTLPNNIEPKIVRDWSRDGTYRVVAELPGKEMEYSRKELIRTYPFEHIPVTPLEGSMLGQSKKIQKIDGYRPTYSPMGYFPSVSQLDFEIAERMRKKKPEEDKPTNIFGTDERYIYQDTRFPWRTVGRIWTASGACTGCTIGPRLVLTASHCINWLTGGGAGWVNFSPGYFNGNGPWGEFYATRVISWNKAQGSLSDFETAFDYVVLVMNDYVGNMVGYPGYRTYSSSWNGDDVWQHMGYPGDLTSTQRPAFQGDCRISSTESESLPGQTGFVLGHFNDVTGGHSGGPIWGWWNGEAWPRVVGVQSAEANTPALNTSGDNEFGGGPALSALITWARNNYP